MAARFMVYGMKPLFWRIEYARINELSPEDLFYRFNVVAEFEYDETA